MLIKVLKAKLHRAAVTQSDLHYEGSIGIDENLLEVSGILPFEAVHVWNIDNASRFETYALPLGRGSGQICINGAAARLAQPGDRVIVAAFCWMDDQQARTHRPTVVLLDEHNRMQPQKAQPQKAQPKQPRRPAPRKS